MKKKLLVLLFSLAVSVGGAACTNQVNVESSADSGEVVQSTEESRSGEPGQGNEEAEGKDGEGQTGEGGEKETAQKVQSYAARILDTGYYEGGSISILDESGAKILVYRWNELVEKLKTKGFDFSACSIWAVDGRTIYLSAYEQDGDYNYINSVFALDLDQQEAVKLFSLSQGKYVDNVDVYEGRIYVSSYYYEDTYKTEEFAFEKDPAQLTYRQVDTEHKELREALDACQNIMMFSQNTDGYSQSCCLDRALAETGFVLGTQDSRYVKITADGLISMIPGLRDSSDYIKAYDKDHVVISGYDEDWNSYLYVTNLNTGALTYVEPERGASANYLALADGYLYYSESVEDIYVHKTNYIYRMQLSTGSPELLYQMESVPGASTIEPGTQKFQVKSGSIFFTGMDEGKTRWFTMDVNASGRDCKAIGDVIEEKGTFRYGQVIYDAYIDNCQFCGISLYKYYGEAFQLDQKYSDNAGKINENLAGILKQEIASLNEVDEGYEPTNEECEYHQENPTIYCTTVEEYVTDVALYSERYLSVDMDGYWYGGGAHGQPYMMQYLFDLTSGDKVTIKDFYKGSEDDFKKLIAQKTKENAESYEDGMSPYYSDDPDEIYGDAYNSVSLDTTQIIFREDHAEVVYQPYEMGPFAAGFIVIDISYEELLGRSGL